MPPAHAACLAMLAPVFTLREDGRRIYAPGGRPLETGDTLAQPGLDVALSAIAEEGCATVYTGTVAELLLAVPGIPLLRSDLERYRAAWHEPVATGYTGTTFLTRAGLSGVPECLQRLPRLGGLSERERVHALLSALDGPGVDGHTTNLVAADADGNACVLTSSLGLGTGDFLPGLDVQLNSMLGEVDLVRDPLVPGERMASMMAPSLAVDDEGLRLAIGSAGGTRLRTALVGVSAAVLDEGLAPMEAVERPRFHRAGDVVNAEPGVDEDALADLAASGLQVRRWPGRHHYFGGVSLISAEGAAADPRRSGHAATL
jgi:gamma-glutamyltranspeptidase/glutathione hydrolase